MTASGITFRIALVCCAFAPAALAVADEALYQPVDYRPAGEADRRFYLSGILGSSWGTLTVDEPPSVNEPLFTAGGAAGMAFERESGRLRLEFEARYRDPIGATFADADSSASLQAANGWSTLVNLWRDVDLTDRFGVYLGGGIGGGGYGSSTVSAAVPAANFTIDGGGSLGGFAWQAGGGAIYELTDRVTLDLGYRFFAVDTGSITATSRQAGVPIETLSFGSGFSASELLFTIRIYEPFRGWR
jgi:opacity protein-like surface antigen